MSQPLSRPVYDEYPKRSVVWKYRIFTVQLVDVVGYIIQEYNLDNDSLSFWKQQLPEETKGIAPGLLAISL